MAYPKKNTGITYDVIVREVQAGTVRPVYYLMGEESYYIDKVSDFIVDSVLQPEEKDFNLITFFGSETDIDSVMTAARTFPMGAQRLVVLVKEAQTLGNIDRLEYYLKQPQPTTVLIFCHKNGTLDRRKKVPTLIEKTGILFESKKIRDGQLPTFIQDYLRRKRIAIEPDAAQIMAEHVGADLNRMVGELDKLVIALPEGQKSIGRDLVLANIGESKEFNVFELQDALARKDIMKVMKIANYFDKNKDKFPPQRILPTVFKFYSNLMLAYYSPQKTEDGIASWLGLQPWQVRQNYIPAMRNYTGRKVMGIISAIRRTDARSKGVGNPSIPPGDLMKELYHFILH